MHKYFIIISMGFILVSGCGGGGGSNSLACGTGNSPYYGCWITPGCQSVSNPINNLEVWSTMGYNFAADGKIYESVKVYTNSSCTGSPNYTRDGFTDFTFIELGTELLASGLTGYRLQVEDVTTGGQGVSEVLVAVTASNQLCLSSSLQLASAESYIFVLQQTPTDVDLVNNCLDAVI